MWLRICLGQATKVGGINGLELRQDTEEASRDSDGKASIGGDCELWPDSRFTGAGSVGAHAKRVASRALHLGPRHRAPGVVAPMPASQPIIILVFDFRRLFS